MKLKELFAQLKRRNVFKAVIAYLAIAWLLVQIASIVFPVFEAPEYAMKALLYFLGIGLIFWTGFSWLYDLTPEGFRKTKDITDNEAHLKVTGQRLNKIIIASLLFVIALLIVNQVIIEKEKRTENNQEFAIRQYQNSIAVLPFKDLSPQQDQTYFSEGMSEGILNLLTKIPDLKVISSSSSFQFRNGQKEIPVIAKELDVNFIIDGSVRIADSLIRITTKLIDGKDGTQIWDRSIDKNFDDVFQIQDEIATSVARQLELAFSDRKLHAATMEFEAYRLYLEADYLYSQFTPDDMILADATVRNAINRDSTYAPAWLLLSKIVDSRYRNYAQIEFDIGQKMAVESVQKAIAIEPEYAEAYAVLADYQAHQNDAKGAREMLEKALGLSSNNAEIYLQGSSMNFYLGDLDQAIRMGHKAVEIDPLNPRHFYILAFFHFLKRDYDNSLKYFEKYIYLNPGSSFHHGLTSLIYNVQGKHEEALAEAEQEPSEWGRLFGLTNAYWSLGEREKSDSLLTIMIDDFGDENGQIVAASYAWRKDNDRAFYWLEKQLTINRAALQEGINLVHFDNIMDDPRWGPFLEKMELPEGHWLLNSK